MGQYANRREICIIVVKITPPHAHLNHLTEKCQVHVAKMILTDQSVLLPIHLQHYDHHLQNEREIILV